MMHQIFLLGCAISSLYLSVSSVRAALPSVKLHDYTNAQVTYGDNIRNQVPFTIQSALNDYKEFDDSVWQQVQYKIESTYTYNFDYSYSRVNFYNFEFTFYRNNSDFDVINCVGDFTAILDGYNLNDNNLLFDINVETLYASHSFTCELTLEATFSSSGVTLSQQKQFLVGDEYDYSFFGESGIITFDFARAKADYTTGYNDGYSDGFNSGYTEGLNSGYSTGYYNGYHDGDIAGSSSNLNFMGLFGAIADTPVIIIRNLFSFDLFGTPALAIFMSCLTAIIVIHFVRKFL